MHINSMYAEVSKYRQHLIMWVNTLSLIPVIVSSYLGYSWFAFAYTMVMCISMTYVAREMIDNADDNEVQYLKVVDFPSITVPELHAIFVPLLIMSAFVIRP